MKANANKSKDSETFVLSPLAEKMAEAVIFIMQLVGIKKLESNKISVADLNKLIAEPVFFENTPDEIKVCGYMLKDSIANILAISGIIGLSIEPSKEETDIILQNYKMLVERAKNYNKSASSCQNDILESSDSE